MKTKNVIVVLAALALSTQLMGQFTFGVAPGMTTGRAYFGYTIASRVVPFIGLQYANLTFNFEESGTEYDWDAEALKPYSESITFKGNVFIPNIGVKCFILERNKLKAFASIDLSKPMVRAKAWMDEELLEDFGEQLEKYKGLGVELSFGAEYFFDKNFSISGEFGFRHLSVRYNDVIEQEIYVPDIPQTVEITRSINGSLNPTFSKVGFNFYFGK